MSMSTVSSIPGTQYREVRSPTRNPQQMQLLEQLMSMLSGPLSQSVGKLGEMANGGTPEMWQQLEAPALRQFGQLQGSLASRFSGMGSGARKSSGFQNTMSGAGADLAERLQGNRMSLQNNAMSQLMQIAQSVLGMDLNDTQFLQKKQPFWKELASSGAEGVGKAIGMLPFLL